MNITYACPSCDEATRTDVAATDEHLDCPHCGQSITVPEDAFDGQRLRRCLVCPSHDLFVRKDFPQQLGVGIVVLGFAISCVTWYFYLVYATFAVLGATVLVDVVLFALMGNAVMCYRCHAQYRGVPNQDNFESFDLETHERYRQQAARLEQAAKSRPSV